MSYIKSANRSRTHDEAVASMIRCRGFEPVDASRDTPMQVVGTKVGEALQDNLKWAQ
eukprot:COSAG06_NODE_784_length_12328_cov_4.921416_4_plen_57_part_00